VLARAGNGTLHSRSRNCGAPRAAAVQAIEVSEEFLATRFILDYGGGQLRGRRGRHAVQRGRGRPRRQVSGDSFKLIEQRPVGQLRVRRNRHRGNTDSFIGHNGHQREQIRGQLDDGRCAFFRSRASHHRRALRPGGVTGVRRRQLAKTTPYRRRGRDILNGGAANGYVHDRRDPDGNDRSTEGKGPPDTPTLERSAAVGSTISLNDGPTTAGSARSKSRTPTSRFSRAEMGDDHCTAAPAATQILRRPGRRHHHGRRRQATESSTDDAGQTHLRRRLDGPAAGTPSGSAPASTTRVGRRPHTRSSSVRQRRPQRERIGRRTTRSRSTSRNVDRRRPGKDIHPARRSQPARRRGRQPTRSRVADGNDLLRGRRHDTLHPPPRTTPADEPCRGAEHQGRDTISGGAGIRNLPIRRVRPTSRS